MPEETPKTNVPAGAPAASVGTENWTVPAGAHRTSVGTENRTMPACAYRASVGTENRTVPAGAPRAVAGTENRTVPATAPTTETGTSAQQLPYAAIFGGVNIDIGGRPFGRLIPHDSNPGTVGISLGGVGRNVAHNLRLLDVPVCFYTAFGDDIHAYTIERSCEALQIDISHALKIPGATSSVYLFVNDEDGDMNVAISDMQICSRITAEYAADHIDEINQAGVLIVDTNIPEETIGYLTRHCNVPIFADPVSVTKAEKLRPYLSRIHTLKPNELEAQELTGIPVCDEKSAARAALKLLEMGVDRVFLSRGRDGVLAACDGEVKQYPCFPANMVNATGAGDAFMAGLVWAYLSGMDVHESVRIASAAAAISVEGSQTINPLLNCDEVIRRCRVGG